MKKVLLVFLFIPHLLHSQIKVSSEYKTNKNSFPLAGKKATAAIYYDGEDYEVVKKSAHFLSNDIKQVTGKSPEVTLSGSELKDEIVIVGTIEKNKHIKELISKGKINVDEIKNQWERYIIEIVEKPFPGVKQALVIAGSDRRGTAYGVFSMSEAIGVSPWYWWADVPVEKKEELYIKPTSIVSKSPSVKYRGVFLNDEDWGLFQWAGEHHDTDIKDIGPKTYAKIYELILRLKGNMVAPAMHTCTGAYYTYPNNKLVADSFGVLVTTSHCEPLLFNNATEWDKKVNGEWNYLTNKEEILKVLDNRVSEASEFENIYTVALRGIHDGGMLGVPEEQRVEVLGNAIADQRAILSKHLKKPAEEIPQVFVPYKEVLKIYEQGLELPDDITIVWPDDNYGYLKRLSNKEEQKRAGGSGVYYHVSYMGLPNDYLWLTTTPPALMYEEMRKAYDFGANRYWLLNVGDIKPAELMTQLFLDMAWDIDRFNYDNINDYESENLAKIFGEEYKDEFNYIKSKYYQLAFSSKPEYMTWDWTWKSLFTKRNIKDTEYSFSNYDEAQNRMQQYNEIASRANAIYEQLPESHKTSFYQLLLYPVHGASLKNKEMLTGQQNRLYASQGRSITNQLAEEVELYHDSLGIITKKYNSLNNNKWDKMMTAPGFLHIPYWSPTETIELPEDGILGIAVSNEDSVGANTLTLPGFNPFTNKSYYIEIYNKGADVLEWEAEPVNDWIILDKTKGNTRLQERIQVSVDWEKAPKGKNNKGEIQIISGEQTANVQVNVFNPQSPVVTELEGIYIEDNGVVSINPGVFHNKVESDNVKARVINGLGYENQSVQLGDIIQEDAEGLAVEYDFYTFSTTDTLKIYSYALPLFAKDKEHETLYGLQIDDGEIHWNNTTAPEYSEFWKQQVIRNAAIRETKLKIEGQGKHTLRLVCGSPGMIIQKIVIDLGGLKKSYTGPESTLVR